MTQIQVAATDVATPVRARRLSPTVARYLSAFRTARGIIGLTILSILVLAALLAPVLFPAGYDHQGREALTSPTLAHPFGLDEFGRDNFARSIYGLRMDLSLIFLAVPLSMGIGMMLGSRERSRNDWVSPSSACSTSSSASPVCFWESASSPFSARAGYRCS